MARDLQPKNTCVPGYLATITSKAETILLPALLQT